MEVKIKVHNEFLYLLKKEQSYEIFLSIVECVGLSQLEIPT